MRDIHQLAVVALIWVWTTSNGTMAFADEFDRVPQSYQSVAEQIEMGALEDYGRYTPIVSQPIADPAGDFVIGDGGIEHHVTRDTITTRSGIEIPIDIDAGPIISVYERGVGRVTSQGDRILSIER